MALPQLVQTPPTQHCWGQSLPLPPPACPLLHAHGQLLPGAQTHQSARAGIPLPGCEGLGIFKAVKFCILAQRPAPRAPGQLRPVWPAQPWTYICPESGRPFTAARYKVQTRLSLRCLKIGKNRLAACGVRAHHASVLVTPGLWPGSGRQSARLKAYCCAWGQAGATRAGPSDWVQPPALPMQHLF